MKYCDFCQSNPIVMWRHFGGVMSKCPCSLPFVSSTPQLQELSQKWQRYIADSKLQLGRNKVCL